MKKFLGNISLIAALAFAAASCVEPDPDYSTFASKDVDFTYAVAANDDGEVEYALDYYVVSTIQFTNTSSKSGNMTWDFGDGTTSTETNPQHKYSEAGTYQVKLTIDGVGSCTYPLMIYDITPVLSIASQSSDILYIKDVSVEFSISLPNPENKRVKYVWTFPDGTLDADGNELTTFTGYADEEGNVDYPGAVTFSNIGSQRITLETTFDLDGENRELEDSYVNVQVGAKEAYKTLYYAALDGNIKALKLIPDSELPEGTENLPFDMGVSSGSMPFNLVYYSDGTEADNNGYILILDAGSQYTYVNDEDGVLGDGKINVMSVDGSSTNVFVTNVGQTAFNDPFFGCVDGSNLLYTDRNTGIRQLPLTTRSAKEESNYFVQNSQLGYYSRGLAYGAISTTIYKDADDLYWWGKCYNGNGIFRFKATDIIDDYSSATIPYPIYLSNTQLKAFILDEVNDKIYVWRSKTSGGFYAYELPTTSESTSTQIASFLMDADPINSTDAEGVYCTQMAVDTETGNVYFGFNKASDDTSSYSTGLHYYDPSSNSIVTVSACAEKMLGITINDNKTQLF